MQSNICCCYKLVCLCCIEEKKDLEKPLNNLSIYSALHIEMHIVVGFNLCFFLFSQLLECDVAKEIFF